MSETNRDNGPFSQEFLLLSHSRHSPPLHAGRKLGAADRPVKKESLGGWNVEHPPTSAEGLLPDLFLRVQTYF